MCPCKAAEYIYILNYQLADSERDLNAIVERLSAEGYKDALVGVGRLGRLTLEFTCRATEAERMMASVQFIIDRAAPTARFLSWLRREKPCASWRWPLWAAIRRQ